MTNRRIYINLLMLAVIIFSYIGLLFFISNEGFKGNQIKALSAQEGIMKQSVSLQEANFEEIQINKSLLNVK